MFAELESKGQPLETPSDPSLSLNGIIQRLQGEEGLEMQGTRQGKDCAKKTRCVPGSQWVVCKYTNTAPHFVHMNAVERTGFYVACLQGRDSEPPALTDTFDGLVVVCPSFGWISAGPTNEPVMNAHMENGFV